jgi:hypothetical protein
MLRIPYVLGLNLKVRLRLSRAHRVVLMIYLIMMAKLQNALFVP